MKHYDPNHQLVDKDDLTPPSFSPGNLLANLYQLTNFEATIAVKVFEISLLQFLDVQICKGQLLEKMQGAVDLTVVCFFFFFLFLFFFL